MNKSVVIIGGGLGGLFTGAMLAKEGCRVTVLEKNRIIGGGLQNFVYRGTSYDTGMHIIGGFHEGGTMRRICSWLGVMDRLSLKDNDPDAMDSITFFSDGRTYVLSSGRDGFADSLSEYFPDERDGLRAYVKDLYSLTGDIALYNLRNEGRRTPPARDDFYMPADRFIARYVRNPKLQEILAYMNLMYGGVKGHTPAYEHAVINSLYIDGPTKFAGGSQQLADALVSVIEDAGGKVLAGKKVCRVAVRDRMAVSAVTEDGDEVSGDVFISSVHPALLVSLVDKGAFSPVYCRRLCEIENSYSAFVVFIKFRERSFPYINCPVYCQDDYGQIWSHAGYDSAVWPSGFMAITPPEKNQGPWADKMIVNCIMDFGQVRRWEDTVVGHRGDEYREWKAGHVERVLSKLERKFPDIRSSIEYVFGASPLTIRDYYGTKDGSLYGYVHDCDNLAVSYLPVFTKVRNLLLTGQNINLHGICGVPLTAIETAEAVLGDGVIVDKINESNYGYRI
ncbi:MAG TPA: NAD(P)/FAD-dependent oxidoreductase [Candidatus Coprenecus pullistercoris]|nr:NAD(P)/FAD-dependent oxidoreductase [Candidatus Coprenecus pullistercoris]